MSFRLRLTVLASLAVAAALVGASFAIYYADCAELIRQTDVDLTATRSLLPPLNPQLRANHGGPFATTPAQQMLALGPRRPGRGA